MQYININISMHIGKKKHEIIPVIHMHICTYCKTIHVLVKEESCFLKTRKTFTSFAWLLSKLRKLFNTPLDDTVLISVFCYTTINWAAHPQSMTRFLHS